jgi:hypothetical protein
VLVWHVGDALAPSDLTRSPFDLFRAFGTVSALVATSFVATAGLAVVETLVAKMRVLHVPRLLAVASLVALLGIAARLVGIA